MLSNSWFAGAWFNGDWFGAEGTPVNTITTHGTATSALTGTVTNPIPVEPPAVGIGGGGEWKPTYRALGRRKKETPKPEPVIISGSVSTFGRAGVSALTGYAEFIWVDSEDDEFAGALLAMMG